jgi:hypothetical protein
MNTTEITNVIPETDSIESTFNEEFAKPQHPAPRAPRHTGLHYVLFITIVVLLAWFAFSVQMYINDINAELDAIRANIVLPL